jgi:hypothetical protein
MNTDQNLSPDHELTKLITKWFQEHGDLKPGEFLSVSITRNFQPIQITFSKSEDSEAKIIRKAAKEARYSSIWHMVDSWGEPPAIVKRIRTIGLDDLRMYRNVGKVSLNLFAKALKKMNLQYPWMEELDGRITNLK